MLERLLNVFRRRRLEEEVRQELESHLAAIEEEELAQGADPQEARRKARIRFGNPTLYRERTHDANIATWFDDLRRDLTFSYRQLKGNPGFTMVAIIMLALGIGVNATVFTVVKAALFAGFPLVQGNDRLLYMTNWRYCCVSYPDFQDWRAQAKSFEGMELVHGFGKVLTDKSGFAESYFVTEVTAGTFKLVGQRPMWGRDFTPSDETPGAPPVAILSYGFWERQYGKIPAMLGKAIRLDGVPTTVIGIMPPGFSFPQKQDLWVPLVPTPAVLKRSNRDTWFVFGRMADGVTIESARAEMETIGKRLERAYPLTNRNLPPIVQNFRGFFIGPNEDIIYRSMWGAVCFVLLIACANLANLMLARSMGRSREISVRIALGAGRWRIIRQLLIESVMLSILGGVLGWWIAKWGVRAYELADRGPGRSSWRILDYSMDYHVLGYFIAISLGTGILFGLAPALRLSKLDVYTSLKDGGRGATGGGRGKHLSALLVTAEMVLAVVLLAGAGVMVRSFLNIYNAGLGVKTTNILTVALNLPEAKYPHADTRISFYDRVKTHLEAIPGVESAAITNAIPTDRALKVPYELSGGAPLDEQQRPKLSALVVSPSYFRTLKTAVLSGREFNDFDGASGLPVAIVNQRFATKFWPEQDPLGKRLRLFDGNTPQAWLTVVGVVPNISQNDSTRQEFDPLVYLPFRQRSTGDMEVIARTRVPPATLATAFRREIQALDSDLPMFGPFTLDERLRGNYWSSGLYGVLFLIFAAIALLLASIGLYAVISHSVNQRTQEIGIRMAIGGTAGDIFKLVFAQGMLPMATGLTVGLVASFAANRILKSALVQVSPSDPITLIAASVVLVSSAALGCWIPARRAIHVDPVVALRHE
jgi:putative ABC transport system permease protein